LAHCLQPCQHSRACSSRGRAETQLRTHQDAQLLTPQLLSSPRPPAWGATSDAGVPAGIRKFLPSSPPSNHREQSLSHIGHCLVLRIFIFPHNKQGKNGTTAFFRLLLLGLLYHRNTIQLELYTHTSQLWSLYLNRERFFRLADDPKN